MPLLAQFIDKLWTSCDHAATLYNGSASDSVIAGDSGHSSCATENSTRLGGYGGDEGVIGVGGAFSAVLTPFFELFRLSRS